MARLTLGTSVETLPLSAPFRISGYVFEAADCVLVTLDDGEHRGRGEASGVYYLGDDVPNMLAAIEAARDAIEAGVSREELRAIMPAGGGRNAVDAALWELESKQTGQPIWELAGLDAPRPPTSISTSHASRRSAPRGPMCGWASTAIRVSALPISTRWSPRWLRRTCL
jgi:L-alanine-DL-glutamate epimerase-like enolase superfamily enzyme